MSAHPGIGLGNLLDHQRQSRVAVTTPDDLPNLGAMTRSPAGKRKTVDFLIWPRASWTALRAAPLLALVLDARYLSRAPNAANRKTQWTNLDFGRALRFTACNAQGYRPPAHELAAPVLRSAHRGTQR